MYVYRIKNIAEDYPVNLLDAIATSYSGNDHLEKWEYPLPSDLLPSVEYAVALLSEREARVIHMRYQNCMTYEEISKIENVTRERIKQIHTKAIMKLRHPCRIFWLIDGVRGRINKEIVSAHDDAVTEHLKSATARLIKISDDLADITGNRVFENAVEEYKRLGMAPDTSITILGLSLRSFNAPSRGGIHTISELLNSSTDDILRIKNLGKQCYHEIVACVHAKGMEFKNERIANITDVGTVKSK